MITITTNWLAPSNISFTPDPNNTNSPWTLMGSHFPIETTKNLRRISLHDIATTSVFSDTLVLTGFTIPTYTTLIGMEIKVNIRRMSRITDYIVQPFVGGSAFNNLATQDGNAANEVIYGGPTELWGIPQVTVINSANFGIYYQVGPHPLYPGTDDAVVDGVAVRLYYQ